MKTKSGYQKLKERVDELERLIRVLVLEPDSSEAIITRMKITTSDRMLKAAMFGSPSLDTTGLATTKGLMSYVSGGSITEAAQKIK